MNPRACLKTLVAILALASTADAATLIVNRFGLLVGATGVNVGDTLYDVEFVDRSCAAIFDGCDAVTDFDFTTQSDALAAAQALLDQVFLNVPGQGTFDDTPWLTVGCPGGDPAFNVCFAFTPFGFQDFLGLHFTLSGMARNFGDGLPDSAVIGGQSPPTNAEDDGLVVYARWSPSPDAAVPEPASLTLLVLGLAGIAARHWRRRKAF
jgi:hypothetical protein